MAQTDAYWYRGVAWLEWLEDPSVVSRPTEEKVMRRLALQTVKAVEHLERVREFVFRRVVKEVLFEARDLTPPPHRLTLREVHARRGIELQWREGSRRGKSYIEVIEVQIEKAA